MKKVERTYAKSKKLILYKAFVSSDLQPLTVNSHMDVFTFDMISAITVLVNNISNEEIDNLKNNQIVILKLQLINDNEDLITYYNDDDISVSISILGLERKKIELLEYAVKDIQVFVDENEIKSIEKLSIELSNIESTDDMKEIIQNIEYNKNEIIKGDESDA